MFVNVKMMLFLFFNCILNGADVGGYKIYHNCSRRLSIKKKQRKRTLMSIILTIVF